VVVHTPGGDVDPAALDAAVARLADLRAVSAVAPPITSSDGHTTVLAVQYRVPVTAFQDAEGLRDLEQAVQPLRTSGARVAFGGEVPDNAQAPDGRAELLGLLAAVVVLCSRSAPSWRRDSRSPSLRRARGRQRRDHAARGRHGRRAPSPRRSPPWSGWGSASTTPVHRHPAPRRPRDGLPVDQAAAEAVATAGRRSSSPAARCCSP
jgi:hypothetical protein